MNELLDIKILILCIVVNLFQSTHCQHTIDLIFKTPIDSYRYGLMDTNEKIFLKQKYLNINVFGKDKYIVKENGKYQILDSNGIALLDKSYYSISNFHCGYAVIKDLFKGYGIIDSDFDIVVKPNYDEIKMNPECKIWLFKKDGKYGFMSNSGEIIMEATFDDAISFTGNIVFVKIADKWGIINLDGEFIIQPEFDRVEDYYHSLVKVIKKRKCGYVSKEGEFVIHTNYAWCDYHTNGIYVTYNDQKIFVFDTTGKKLFETASESVNRIHSDLFHVVDNKAHYFVNSKGKTLTKTKYENILVFSEKLIAVKEKENYYFMNENLDYDPLKNYDYIEPEAYFSMVRFKINEKWGLCDLEGNLLVNSLDYEIWPINDALVKYYVNNKVGLMTNYGKILTEPMFQQMDYFDFNKALVKFEEKYGVIDTLGKVIVEPKYDDIKIFEKFIAVKRNSKWGIMNDKGELIRKIENAFISDAYGPYILFKKNETFGMINPYGEVKINTGKYTSLVFFIH